MTEELTDAKIAVAGAAAATAKEAELEAIRAAKKERHEELVIALKEAITDDDPINRPLLIKRIPAICIDVHDIKNTLQWQNRIAAFLIPIILTVLGYFAYQIFNDHATIASDSAYIKTILQHVESTH